MNYKYITKEEISVAYFQFPKFLLKYPISQNGKVVYMLLYDRARLSQMNNWLDEKWPDLCDLSDYGINKTYREM